ncbi:MAG: kelch repeat-containing protein [Pseudomonadota bacterium]
MSSYTVPANPLSILFALLLLTTAGGANASVDYIEDMEPYEVRALTGAFAPTNGNETMEDATPQDWLDNDPSVQQLRGVVRSWSGGFKAVEGTKLWVHGGGHRDSANNGIYQYDFAGTDGPVGFELISISDVADVRFRDGPNGEQFPDYLDGKPLSTHTYDGLVFAHHNNTLYRFGGAPYDEGGGGSETAWKFDLGTGEWTRLPDLPAVSSPLFFLNLLYDPETRKIALSRGRFTTVFFNCDTDTWGGQDESSRSIPFQPDRPSAWDPSRDRGLQIGVGASFLWNIDFENETTSLESVALSGDREIEQADAPSPMFDAGLNTYWVIGGDDESPGWSSLYEINASTFAVTRHPLTGDVIEQTLQQGSYGRFVFLEDDRAIGIVAAHDKPAYIIRLPKVVIPEPPTNLQITN